MNLAAPPMPVKAPRPKRPAEPAAPPPSPTPPTDAGPSVRRFTPAEFRTLTHLGLFDPDPRTGESVKVELLDGVIVEHPPAGTPRPRLWTGDDYDKMLDTDLFGPGEDGCGGKVELLDGVILNMAAQKDSHQFGVLLTDNALRLIFPPDAFTVRVQLPIRAADGSEPEPDLSVVAGGVRRQRHKPTSALLVVEVSDTTLAADRAGKLAKYAQTGVGDYWILNLIDACLEVHRRPEFRPDGTWGYAERLVLPPDESIAPSPVRARRSRWPTCCREAGVNGAGTSNRSAGRQSKSDGCGQAERERQVERKSYPV